jgi:hypothetical protein
MIHARIVTYLVLKFNFYYLIISLGFKEKNEYNNMFVLLRIGKFSKVYKKMTFPILNESNRTFRKRSNEDYQEDAINAEAHGSVVYGIKGKTVLNSLINYPDSIPIDSLHLMNEGIFKCLVSLWFDSKHKNQEWYLGIF